jgi:hypothetical protein
MRPDEGPPGLVFSECQLRRIVFQVGNSPLVEGEVTVA